LQFLTNSSLFLDFCNALPVRCRVGSRAWQPPLTYLRTYYLSNETR